MNLRKIAGCATFVSVFALYLMGSAIAATVYPLAASSGDKAATTAAVTLAGVPGKTTYLDQVIIKANGATAAGCVQFAITGADNGTISWDYCFAAGVAAVQPADIVWIPVDRYGESLIRASSGGSITATLPALGAGNVHASLTVLGHVE